MYICHHPGFKIALDTLQIPQLLNIFQLDRPNQTLQFVNSRLGQKYVSEITVSPLAPMAEHTLEAVHNQSYVSKALHSNKMLMQAFELREFAEIPFEELYKHIITPMLLTVSGVTLATEQALKTGKSVAMTGGGYHHARRNLAGGFCVFADVAIAINVAREHQLLGAEDIVLYIDTDAHFGNGVAEIFADDPSVRILDIFNQDAFPLHNPNTWPALNAISHPVPVAKGCEDDLYLELLEDNLAAFLAQSPGAKLAFYNAGNDPFAQDKLGGLNLSYAGILKRDRLVINSLKQCAIPTIMLPSGGYSPQSPELYGQAIITLLKTQS